LPVSEISREQEYVARVYERVDALREQAAARLAVALREDGGTAQSRLDRDAAIARYTGQLARLDAAESCSPGSRRTGPRALSPRRSRAGP
jgi:hypothetical protein